MAHNAPWSPDVITNVAFGLTGAALTIVMIWQAARYAARRSQALGAEQDIELATTAIHNESSQSLPLEALPEPDQKLEPTPGELADIAPPATALLRGPQPHS